jgi:hypothetical protein
MPVFAVHITRITLMTRLVGKVLSDQVKVSILDDDTTIFNILVGLPPEGQLETLSRYHVVLVRTPHELERFREEILVSGVRIGITWNLWRDVIDREQFPSDYVHIFQSFGQFWTLPCGWGVAPVSDGFGGSNWVFQNQETCMLVAGPTSCIGGEVQCFHPPLWRPHVDTRVHLLHTQPSTTLPPCRLEEVKSFLPASVPLLQLSCPVEIVGAVLALLPHLPENRPCISLYGSDLTRQLARLPQMFEWLHEDTKTYIMKCAKFQVDRNQPDGPLVLADVVITGRVKVVEDGGAIPDNTGLVIGAVPDELARQYHLVSGERLLPVSSFEDLCGFYNTESCSQEELNVDHLSLTEASNWSNDSELLNVLTRRYPNVSQGSNITIPSIRAELSIGAESISITSSGNSKDLAELVHIVS